jgi:hypothetical protein
MFQSNYSKEFRSFSTRCIGIAFLLLTLVTVGCSDKSDDTSEAFETCMEYCEDYTETLSEYDQRYVDCSFTEREDLNVDVSLIYKYLGASGNWEEDGGYVCAVTWNGPEESECSIEFEDCLDTSGDLEFCENQFNMCECVLATEDYFECAEFYGLGDEESEDGESPAPPPTSEQGSAGNTLTLNFSISRRAANRLLNGLFDVQAIKAGYVYQSDTGKGKGLLLSLLPDNSLVQELSLRSGDVIVRANGMPITTTQEAFSALAQLREAEKVDLRIRRNGLPILMRYSFE